MNISELTFRPVLTDNWADLEKLFESRGCPHHCWCMVWRKMESNKSRSVKADKKQSLRNYVFGKIPVGLLCYYESEPVAWCSIAPRESYRELSGIKSLNNVWSLVCFFIKREYRQQGLTEKFIGEALKYARNNGADYVEAYPVESDSPGYKFMGLKQTFVRSGFKFSHKAGLRRNVMIIKL